LTDLKTWALANFTLQHDPNLDQNGSRKALYLIPSFNCFSYKFYIWIQISNEI